MTGGLHTARLAAIPASAFVALTMAVSAIALAVLIYLALDRTGGVFGYPLDDTYIHLAMAEEIAHFGYGVNPGEYASASSSALYPLLLAPAAATDAALWAPLAWNVLALAAASALIGLIFAEARLGWPGLVLAAGAPVALNMYAVAYSGMENMAHGAASLGIVLGLWRFVESYRIGWLLVLGVILAPAFRPEGLGLALAAGGVVLVLGRPLTGLGLMLLGLLPAALFAGFLVWLGLDPLPSSVMAKLSQGVPADAGPVTLILSRLLQNAAMDGGRYLLGMSVLVLLVAARVMKTDGRRGWFGLAVAAAGFAHIAVGSVGWMDRYENYALLALVGALALLLVDAVRPVQVCLVGLALAGGLFAYGPRFRDDVENMSAIRLQQGQMARFAKDFVKAPVAVNDIGYVAWRNPNYVLDLWGLASRDALRIRMSTPPQGWGAKLAAAKAVKLAMIYDAWVGDAVGPEWVRLGTLSIDAPGAFLGGLDVAFYATGPAEVPALRAMLEEWRTGLPERSWFVFAEDEPA